MSDLFGEFEKALSSGTDAEPGYMQQLRENNIDVSMFSPEQLDMNMRLGDCLVLMAGWSDGDNKVLNEKLAKLECRITEIETRKTQ